MVVIYLHLLVYELFSVFFCVFKHFCFFHNLSYIDNRKFVSPCFVRT